MKKIYPKFSAKVRNGQLFLKQTDEIVGYLQTMPELVDIVIKPHTDRKERSNNQNRYYWGVVIGLLSEHTGYSVDECHEILKSLFLKEKLALHTKNGDRIIDTPKSTTSLSTAEMEQFLSDVRGFCALELGLSIPEPNELEIE